MKKIELKGLDTSIFYEKLDNGLEVYLLPYQDKSNYYITYATKFGSLQTEFVPVSTTSKNKSKMIKVPDGIAHFLEHKMFEQEDGIDPFTFYSKTGTGSNASTSFESTQYLCYGNQNLKENLEYLLKFVNEPYFTDENVEKEKGIIAEEIKMYDDIPEWQLEEEIRKSLYKVHPMRVDIAGTVEEINKITKEDLYTCYNTYYQPGNMFLIIAGKINPNEVIDVVKQQQLSKQPYSIQEKKYDEKEQVFQETKQINSNIVVPKVGFAFKFDRNKISIEDEVILDMYLQMFSTITFGISSNFRERVREKQLINSFYSQWEKADHYRSYIIMCDTEKPDELLNEIKQELSRVEINENDVERMKKVWISSEVQMIDVIENSVNNLYDDIIKYGKMIPNKLELIRKLNATELRKIIKEINFNNHIEVKMLPKQEKAEVE